jgi:hypothetical protein
MNETLKQNRLQRDHVNDGSCSYIGEDKSNANGGPDDVHATFIVFCSLCCLFISSSCNCHLISFIGLVSYFDSQDDKSGRTVGTNNVLRNRAGSTQKAMSLPTSPHDYGGEISETSDNCDFVSKEKMVFAWNKVLQSSPFNKPLLPFQEWNIDFSELTIGTRVGIGKSS